MIEYVTNSGVTHVARIWTDVPDRGETHWHWECSCGTVGDRRNRKRNAVNGASVHLAWHNRKRLEEALRARV